MSIRLVNGVPKRVPPVPITSCDGCGACCRHMGTPPGYAAFACGRDLDASEIESDDYGLWLHVPEDAKNALREYYRAMMAGEKLDRSVGHLTQRVAQAEIAAGRLEGPTFTVSMTLVSIPCLWYDAAAGRCSQYEHRPTVCRDAIVPADEACRATRSAHRIPLPQVTP